MHCNKSKVAAVALVAAIALGGPALAKSRHGAKAKHLASLIASLSTCSLKAEPGRGSNPYGSTRRAPTFGAPNPNSPAFIGGGGTGYNVNFYVY
jgi:hypothetical protein